MRKIGDSFSFLHTVNNRPSISGFSMHCSSCGKNVLEKKEKIN